MTAFASLASGELKIETLRDPTGTPIDLFFRGRSIERHPARTIVPYVSEILATAHRESAVVRLHFETIDHMNSSTITAIIQIIQEARSRSTPLVVVFDALKNWQKLSFEALAVFVKDDDVISLVGARKNT